MSETIRIRPGAPVQGAVGVPGDKSISHRALMLGALAEGVGQVRNWLSAGDTLATLRIMQALAITIQRHDETTLSVYGQGLRGLRAPNSTLDCANAGTAMRLLAGILAGQPFGSVLDGSVQLRHRPMKRITQPLRQMGAVIADDDGHAPLRFSPTTLHGLTYHLPVASAQVKSCLLLAGLYADGPTTIIEPGPARDHTERMLHAMGADLVNEGAQITITPGQPLQPLDLSVPGDMSSAAFVLVAALISSQHQGTTQVISVGTNPTRTGILDILRRMGAKIELTNERDEGGEPVADLAVTPGLLRGAEINGALIVRAIDEFPALMVAALCANGETVVRDARELRVKETDRIAVMAVELRKLGADIDEFDDGFRVIGPQTLRGTVVQGHDDHRVAMALAVAGLVADGETLVEDAACVEDSFPGFVETLQTLGADAAWLTPEAVRHD